MERRLRALFLLVLFALSALLFFPRAPYLQEWIAPFGELFVAIYLGSFFLVPKIGRFKKITFLFLAFGFYSSVSQIFFPHLWVGSEKEALLNASFPSVKLGLLEKGTVLFGTSDGDFLVSKEECVSESKPYWIKAGSIFFCSKYPFGSVSDLGSDVDEAKVSSVMVGQNLVNIALLDLSAPESGEAFSRARITFRRLATVTRHSEQPWLIITSPFSSLMGRSYGSLVSNLRVRDALVGSAFRMNWMTPMIFYRRSPFGIFVKRLNIDY